MQGFRSGIRKIAPVAVVVLGLSAAAWGHGFWHERHGLGGDAEPDGGHGGCSGRLIKRLVFPCRAQCVDTVKSCVGTTKNTAVTCVSAACTNEIAAAQSACQANPDTTGCDTALETLKTCAQNCSDSARTAMDACRTTASSCFSACG